MMKATRSHADKHQKRQEKINKHKKKQALLNFVEGAALYGLCISLPAILGVFVRFYENQYYFSSNNASNQSIDGSNTYTSQFEVLNRLTGFLSNFLQSTSIPYNVHPAKNSHLNATLNDIPKKISGELNDFHLICILSILLAALRSTIIYLNVPPQKVEKKRDSLVRCRSIHMLRSYDLTSPIKSSPSQEQPQQQQQQQQQQQHEKRQNSQYQQSISAQRFASALFRILYTSITSLSAFYLLRNADFWPVYLGGKPTSSTSNCWDLSGGIAFAGVDQDFDHYNSPLRYYFVVQASYQIQSLFFHCVVFLIRGWKFRKSWTDFLRTVAEHIIALALLSGSFLFSSWRRLCAVAMFALDASGLFLHVLQLCLNSSTAISDDYDNDQDEEDAEIHIKTGAVLVGQSQSVDLKREQMKKKQRRKNIIWFIHRCLVLPSFMYCRFFILPFIVWYSAAFESHDWLKQMEHAFVPGWGDIMYYFFNTLVLIIVSLNLVLFRRLLFHPHVAQVLQK